MTVRRRIMISLVWTTACFIVSALSIYYFMNHPVPGVSEDVVAERLGNVVGVVLTLGYMALWLPYAFQAVRKRRERRV